MSLLCGLGLLLGSATRTQAATEQSAKELIEAQAKTILRAAHPTGKLGSLTCDSSRKTASGYDLTYTIGWTGVAKGEHHTTLLFGFAFNRHGEIDKIKITVEGDSSSVEPFKLNKVAIGVLRGVLKVQLKRHLPKDVAQELGKEVDRIGNAKDLLAFWLKHVGNKTQKAGEKAPEKDALQEKILRLIEIQGGDKSVREQFFQGFTTEFTGVPDAEFREWLAGEAIEELSTRMVAMYTKHYTEEEVDEIIAFYQTPVGRKLSEKQPVIMHEVYRLKMAWALKEWKSQNENAAIGTLRTIASVQTQFRDADRDGDGIRDYAVSLKELNEASLIDEKLASGRKWGYIFGVSGSTSDWQASATALSELRGWRNFIVCTDGVVRFSTDEPADCSSPPIE